MNKMGSVFKIIHQDKNSNARIGKINTEHGIVETPAFMPVATKGAVKTLSAEEVSKIGYQIILSNTYHILERPGLDIIKKHGGIHKFMHWDKPILTDSGGYQVFSLSRMVEVTDEGVSFRSLIDGSKRFATPELVVKWQEELGADIAMVLDECIPYGSDKKIARSAMERTIEWAGRSKDTDTGNKNLLFGIVQGNFYGDLRRESALRTVEIGFPGYAIGGLSVGEPEGLMWEMAEISLNFLPDEKPIYFMGLGDPIGLLKGIHRGIDLFDSALPTRIARGGSFFTGRGSESIRNAKFKDEIKSLDEECNCPVCKKYSAAYIRHLYLSEETLALEMLTYHNLYFLKQMLDGAKVAIRNNSFSKYKNGFFSRYMESKT